MSHSAPQTRLTLVAGVGDALGGGAKLLQAQTRTAGHPAGQRRGRPFGGVRCRAGQLQQFAHLPHGWPRDPCLPGEGGDPFIAGHRWQLSLHSAPGRGSG